MRKLTNNSDTSWNEKLFEAMLGVAVEEAVTNEMAALPTREELDAMYPQSEAFEKKIRQIIAKEEKTYSRMRNIKVISKVAACFSIFLTISAIILMSVEASRVFILNTFINIQEDHVAFEFGDLNNGIHREHKLFHEGFEYITSQKSDNISISIYRNDDGEQIIFQQHVGANLRTAIDNDYRDFLPKYIHSQEAYLFESDGEEYHVVMWAEENTVYIILSKIDISELLALVEELIKGG